MLITSPISWESSSKCKSWLCMQMNLGMMSCQWQCWIKCKWVKPQTFKELSLPLLPWLCQPQCSTWLVLRPASSREDIKSLVWHLMPEHFPGNEICPVGCQLCYITHLSNLKMSRCMYIPASLSTHTASITGDLKNISHKAAIYNKSSRTVYNEVQISILLK